MRISIPLDLSSRPFPPCSALVLFPPCSVSKRHLKLVFPFHYDFLWLTDWSPHNRSVHLIMSSSGHTPERVGKETKHTMTWQSRVTECHNRTRVCTSSSHQKGTRTYSRESQESVRCLPHSGRGPVVRRQGLGEEDWGLFESSSSFFYWYLITS